MTTSSVDQSVEEGSKVDLERSTIFWLKPGIVKIYYKDGNELSIQDHREIFETVRAKYGTKKVKLLLTAGDWVSHSKEAFKYSTSKEVMQFCICLAMIVDSPGKQLVGNFFLKIFRPAAPTKFFKNEEEAFNWLESFPVL